MEKLATAGPSGIDNGTDGDEKEKEEEEELGSKEGEEKGSEPATRTTQKESANGRSGQQRGRGLVQYPREFYTGRRGSYPFAPGLKAFSHSLLFHHSTSAQSPPAKPTKDSPPPSSPNRDDRADEKDEALNRLVDDAVTNERRGLLRRFDVRGFELAHHGSVNDAVFSPSESRVATAGGDALIKIWDPRDGSYVRRLQGHSNEGSRSTLYWWCRC